MGDGHISKNNVTTVYPNKGKLSHLTSPMMKKEAQCLVGFLGSVKFFGSQKNLCLGILLRPICQVALKAVRFKWNLEQERTLQQVLTPL